MLYFDMIFFIKILLLDIIIIRHYVTSVSIHFISNILIVSLSFGFYLFGLGPHLAEHRSLLLVLWLRTTLGKFVGRSAVVTGIKLGSTTWQTNTLHSEYHSSPLPVIHMLNWNYLKLYCVCVHLMCMYCVDTYQHNPLFPTIFMNWLGFMIALTRA